MVRSCNAKVPLALLHPPRRLRPGATGQETTAEPPTEAACIITNKHEDIPEVPMTCGLPELCPGDQPLLFEPLDNDGWSTGDIERARCMAAAMRDRTPGLLRFRHYGVTAWEDNRTIEILGDVAILTHTASSDFNVDYAERVAAIRQAGFFVDCAEGSAFAVHECLVKGLGDECIDTLACPD